MQRDEMQKRRRDVMVACPFILPGHLLLGVVVSVKIHTWNILEIGRASCRERV